MPATPQPSNPWDRTGKVVGGKYKLIRLLGKGGMGEVYEAQNSWTRGRVAIKLLRPAVSGEEETVHRFIVEARAAAKVVHPNIVAVLDLGQDATADGLLFMVQEFLTGESLRDRLKKRGRLQLREALDVAIPIMGAAAAAHEQGVLHRDIKPENIVLSRSPSGSTVPKLIDFGISKVRPRASRPAEADGEVQADTGDPDDPSFSTEIGIAVGTPSYMSPEQLRGDRTIDGRTDVWAMGVVLYEMLAGHPPFESRNLLDLSGRILRGDLLPLQKEAAEVPAEVCAVVHDMLQPDREKRAASMREVVDRLLECPALVVEAGSEPLVRRYRSSVLWRAADVMTTWVDTSGPEHGGASTSATMRSVPVEQGELHDTPEDPPPDADREPTLDEGAAVNTSSEVPTTPRHPAIRPGAGAAPAMDSQAMDAHATRPLGNNERASVAAAAGPSPAARPRSSLWLVLVVALVLLGLGALARVLLHGG
jgi:serine/threonine-protein kinase